MTLSCLTAHRREFGGDAVEQRGLGVSKAVKSQNARIALPSALACMERRASARALMAGVARACWRQAMGGNPSCSDRRITLVRTTRSGSSSPTTSYT
jgi:hypothetical protein